ncbi:MAG: bifunctional pyr operon transcriptional regulator/uracil phosphoribosyltransferase PyrR [Deltaproteobacteria bacterium]|nr:bifunctional pyr operon transcriptional regulator/uracil phosphoribosyltransferase PyrR [Deltaproteobacteria bacterium]MCL5792358.1 bifunctional pyr operon transcriptional regulator/uracil phosphoribosyltransferase PyrR [Deltaproteobacteria bacterium]
MKNLVMDVKMIERALKRIAHEIIELHTSIPICFVGVRTNGVFIANRLAAYVKSYESIPVKLGTLDITLYRDDIAMKAGRAILKSTEIDFPVDNAFIILVDDVLFTGRTIRAAMDAIIDLGRPKVIQLAILVDRGHRELPIRADYAGKNVPTSVDDEIKVEFKEGEHDEDAVYLIEKGVIQ